MLTMGWAVFFLLLGTVQMTVESSVKLRAHGQLGKKGSVGQDMSGCDIEPSAPPAVEGDLLTQRNEADADQSILPRGSGERADNVIILQPAGNLDENAYSGDESSLRSSSSQSGEFYGRPCGGVDDMTDGIIFEELEVVSEEDEPERYDSNLKGAVIGVVLASCLICYHMFLAKWILGYEPDYSF